MTIELPKPPEYARNDVRALYDYIYDIIERINHTKGDNEDNG
jgi:hypothetical protein